MQCLGECDACLTKAGMFTGLRFYVVLEIMVRDWSEVTLSWSRLTAMGFENVLTARDVNFRANDMSSLYEDGGCLSSSPAVPYLQRHSIWFSTTSSSSMICKLIVLSS